MKKLLFLLLIVLVFVVNGCKEGESSESYSSSYIGLDGSEWFDRVILVSSSYVSYVGQHILLTVTCVDKVGAPYKDIKVTFSCDNGGEFENKDGETDETGALSNIFTPTKEGVSLVSVSALGRTSSIDIDVLKPVAFTDPLKLYLASDTVNIDGKLLVQVFVGDGNGDVIKNATVNMQCMYGSFSPESGETNESGWFTTTYTASSTVGTDIITSMSMGNVATATISVQ